MTVAPSNGYNRSNSVNSSSLTPANSNGLNPDLVERVVSRPDRNTHNGQPAHIHTTTEENKEK